MKRLIILISLTLGVMSTEGKPKYRIETWVRNGTTFYLPQKRVWMETNYFSLPIKVWESGSYPFQYKYQAENIIQNWKDAYREKTEHKKSYYYTVE